jgi:hypothetical protein
MHGASSILMFFFALYPLNELTFVCIKFKRDGCQQNFTVHRDLSTKLHDSQRSAFEVMLLSRCMRNKTRYQTDELKLITIIQFSDKNEIKKKMTVAKVILVRIIQLLQVTFHVHPVVAKACQLTCFLRHLLFHLL